MLFDSDGDGQINFEEFIGGISMMCEQGDFTQKVQFSFQVYDEDKDDRISKEELANAFSDVMETRDIAITKEQMSAVINATFKQAKTANADYITYEEYSSLIKCNPNSLQNFMQAYSVDIDAALQNAAAMHRAEKKKRKK